MRREDETREVWEVNESWMERALCEQEGQEVAGIDGQVIMQIPGPQGDSLLKACELQVWHDHNYKIILHVL